MLFIEMHQHFGIRFCREPMPATLQLSPQFSIVVDLAVEDHLQRTVLIPNRLIAAIQVNNRQSAMHSPMPRPVQ